MKIKRDPLKRDLDPTCPFDYVSNLAIHCELNNLNYWRKIK
jgi:hypothetical protein